MEYSEYRWSSQDSKSSSVREHQAGPPSATLWSCSAQNHQQKRPEKMGLAFKPLKMQQSSEKQQQLAWGALGLAQLCTICPPRIRFLVFPSLCSNSRPTNVTSCSLSALVMDPSWHAITKNSALGGGNGPFLLYLGKKKCCKIFSFRKKKKNTKWLEGHWVPKVKCTRTGGHSDRAEKFYWRGFQGALQKQHYKVRLRQSELCPSTRQFFSWRVVCLKLQLLLCFLCPGVLSHWANSAGRIGRVSLSLNARLDAVL